VAALCLSLTGAARGGQSISITWDTNIDASVTGYRLYMGPTSSNYVTSFDAGTNTTVTITGLKEGQTNYFTVAAYNASRMESAPSVQMSYVVPGLLVSIMPTNAGDPLKLNFPVAPGHSYEVQASVDLTNWTKIYQTATATSNAWTSFQDPQTASFPKRFYRLVLH
jgi:hypothetical protein